MINNKLDGEGHVFAAFEKAPPEEEVVDEFKTGFLRMVGAEGGKLLSGDEIDLAHIREVLSRRGIQMSDSSKIEGDLVTAEFNGKSRTFHVSSIGKMLFVKPSLFLIEDFESDEAWAANMSQTYFSL